MTSTPLPTLLSILQVFLNLLIFLALAPLFDGIVRRVTARVQNRQGPPLVQSLYDILKLLGKENIDSTGILPFRLAPLIAFASMLCVIAILPMAGRATALTQYADAISLVYLLTLGGVAVLLGAFASKNIYALIGASREMTTMIMVEPILFMILLLGVLKTGSLDLGAVIYGTPMAAFGLPGVVMIVVSLFGLQAFVARQPFDMAEAEQELLGGPFIEYSGPNYALFKYYMMLKQMFYAYLPIAMFVPLLGTGFYLADLALQLALTALVFLLIGLLSATHPRYRIDQAIRYFGVLFLIALGAIAVAVVL
ncbi:respiratory chain complex I subunit 1 family protein [Chitinilyticum piscinae]|uniref:NADH-quinone oxidoreductase subunit H n=1 Tax=Chitinilyticum piscinae TaxID=2866724 RepID=A0A8J7FIN9_9NEIS|nr:complex I subunit 1 family protein [Chitinilyticum piscinae]MBE9610015.1 NADH-quinone oxidoreductase subunit H [Chitinilyticum piscinae]